MQGTLTPKERETLLKRHRKAHDGRVRDRIKAVLAYDDGYSYSEIARILLLDDETVRRHIKAYLSGKKLKPSNGGSTGKLTDGETSKLIAHLEENTYLYVKDICQYIKKTFNKKYSISGMTKWLQNHNFRYKKPHAVPAKADKNKQEEFLIYYDRLKKKAKKNEPIYFVDSVHPQHQTKLSYGWILKGKRKEIPTTARQKRLNFMGGICLMNHKIVYKNAEKIDTDSIKSFLKRLRSVNKEAGKIHVIWDNAAYHRSHRVKDYAKKLSIELHYLPPYSPNLNPVERLWKMMHEAVSYNTYYETFFEFTEATLNFFRNIGRRKKILRSRITDNFQTINSPVFAP